jgi:hypothetical protein
MLQCGFVRWYFAFDIASGFPFEEKTLWSGAGAADRSG